MNNLTTSKIIPTLHGYVHPEAVTNISTNDWINKSESGVFGLYKQIRDDVNLFHKENVLIRIDHTDHLFYHCSKCGLEKDIKLVDGGALNYFSDKFTRKLWITLKCKCHGWSRWRKFYVYENEKRKNKKNTKDFVYEHPEATEPLTKSKKASKEEVEDYYTKLLKESLEIEKQHSEILIKKLDIQKKLAKYEQFLSEIKNGEN